MRIEENKAIIRRWLEDVWGKGDFAVEAELVSPNYLDHNASPGSGAGLASHHQMLLRVREAFPDLEMEIDVLVAEGDYVVDRYTCRGTHLGEYFGVAATGLQVTFSGIDVVRVTDGKIAELWHNTDHLGVLRQLGAF